MREQERALADERARTAAAERRAADGEEAARRLRAELQGLQTSQDLQAPQVSEAGLQAGLHVARSELEALERAARQHEEAKQEAQAALHAARQREASLELLLEAQASDAAAERRRLTASLSESEARAAQGRGAPQGDSALHGGEEEEGQQQQQERTPVDELTDLLELLYNEGLKSPQRPVQNAAQLVELLRRDPDWFERVSKGMSVARHEGGKMDEARLMSLFADPDGGGQRVAQVLRRRNARKHWSLGPVEAALSRGGDAFGELHKLMQAEASTRKTEKVMMTGAKRTQASRWTVREWEEKAHLEDVSKAHLEDVSSVKVSSVKVLHWPVRSEEAVNKLVEYPEWLQRNNWVSGFDEGKRDRTFDVMLQLVHSHGETGAVTQPG